MFVIVHWKQLGSQNFGYKSIASELLEWGPPFYFSSEGLQYLLFPGANPQPNISKLGPSAHIQVSCISTTRPFTSDPWLSSALSPAAPARAPTPPPAPPEEPKEEEIEEQQPKPRLCCKVMPPRWIRALLHYRFPASIDPFTSELPSAYHSLSPPPLTLLSSPCFPPPILVLIPPPSLLLFLLQFCHLLMVVTSYHTHSQYWLHCNNSWKQTFAFWS